jgi:hypothetical protein
MSTMRRGIAVLTALAMSVLVGPALANHPNSGSGTAQLITGHTGIVSANTSPGHIPTTGAAWYRWVATGNGTAMFTTCSPGSSNYDTTITVYNSGLGQIAFNDDANCGFGGFPLLGSRVFFGVSLGSTYYVNVDGFGGGLGRFDLHWSAPLADGTPPTVALTSRNPVANGNGWNNVDVTLGFTATDNAGGSGVASMTCSATGAGAFGASSTAGSTRSVTVTAPGITTVQCSAADNAGNASGPVSEVVRIDRTAPTIDGTSSPDANGSGWNNEDVTVSFTCSDALSDIDTCSDDTVLTEDGSGQSVTGTAVDKAGNSATATVDEIDIDQTAPEIEGDRSPEANANGWNNTAVTVSFSCSDELSDIDSCSGGTTLTSEGAGQSITGTAVDNAGNSATATVGGINIDFTPPTLACPSAITLWPPNHRLVDVVLNVIVAGGVLTLDSATSSEPDNGLGDGDTANDVQNAELGTADTSVSVRAERRGGGSGRTYTFGYSAQDLAGNGAQCWATVVVPHDKRR